VAKLAAKQVAVIGAGWAGCAAAAELARQGHAVTLFEAARTLGGRARRVEFDGKALDNGQHILLGAYTESLRLLRLVGIDPDTALLRLPLQMCYPPASGGMDFIAARLPAPLHLLGALLRATGLSTDDKLALARFSTTARWMEWRLDTDCTVTELLERFDQTARLTQLMWRPLCLAALNTPPERASAQVFLNVLRDSLGARRAASDMLLPRLDLSALFPQQAASYIAQHGGNVQLGTTVRQIRRDAMRWQLTCNDDREAHHFDAVIVATHSAHAAALLDELIGPEKPTTFTHEPITTCYLQYAPTLKLARPLFALLDDPQAGAWGQFVFDRGQLDANQAGLLAVVVSASATATELGQQALANAIAAQLASVFKQPELATPLWSKVISEKRATYACTPALRRPANATGVAGLLIAGDYTAGEYPATLEAAIRSGVQAAALIGHLN
jgi:hydroxysqualene dehydroxylase